MTYPWGNQPDISRCRCMFSSGILGRFSTELTHLTATMNVKTCQFRVALIRQWKQLLLMATLTTRKTLQWVSGWRQEVQRSEELIQQQDQQRFLLSPCLCRNLLSIVTTNERYPLVIAISSYIRSRLTCIRTHREGLRVQTLLTTAASVLFYQRQIRGYTTGGLVEQSMCWARVEKGESPKLQGSNFFFLLVPPNTKIVWKCFRGYYWAVVCHNQCKES